MKLKVIGKRNMGKQRNVTRVIENVNWFLISILVKWSNGMRNGKWSQFNEVKLNVRKLTKVIKVDYFDLPTVCIKIKWLIQYRNN